MIPGVLARARASRAIASFALVLALTSCIASNVVAPEQRMVGTAIDGLADGDPANGTALAWRQAPGFQLDGLYETIDITGEAATSLRKVWYLFDADGTYTAAALIEGDEYAFQTLSGTWENDRDSVNGLILDDGEPVSLEQADEHLRITAPNGMIVLRRRRNWR